MKAIQLFFTSLFFTSFRILAQDFNDSGWCQDNHNINDSPWNASVKNMKDAVFIFHAPYRRLDDMSIVYPFSCTGNLINQNTNQNNLNEIFVTAEHCCSSSKDWDHDKNDDTPKISCELVNDNTTPWKFYFNYSSPGPNNSEMTINARDGLRYYLESPVSIKRKISGVDFAMCEISQPAGIPPHFNVYYQGWSVSLFQGLQLPNYVIHHPKSDIKKWAKTHSTFTVTNYPCHIVTEVIDVIYWGLFGWWTGTQINTTQVCNYVESPFWTVPIWSCGVTEPGSSGSGLLNMQQRLIGVLSHGLGSCDFPVGENFGKLSTAVIESPTIKNILEPNNFWAVNADGRRIMCRTDLIDLNGQYFPAKDYQPENKIQLKAANEITTKANSVLNIRSGSDFDFIAGNAIRLRPGFRVEANANFKAKIGNDCAGFTGNRMAVEPVPVKSKFKIGGLIRNSNLAKSIQFEIGPNPSLGKIVIRFGFPQKQAVVDLKVFASDGKLVFAKTLQEIAYFQSEIDLSNLANGVYSLHLISPQISLNRRLVVTK